MRIIDLREVSLPISRYADASAPSGGLNTSMLALITDVIRDGKPVVGYGFASIGRLAQSGLNRERFAPRQLAASEVDLTDEAGTNLDPFRAWRVMMTNEKPGGHGERCVAVGALDMGALGCRREDRPAAALPTSDGPHGHSSTRWAAPGLRLRGRRLLLPLR